MAKVNKSRNLFLELEELNRMEEFNVEDTFKFFLSKYIKKGGIVPGSNNSLGNNFLPVEGSLYNRIKFTEDSVAYNTLGERIFYPSAANHEWEIDVSGGGTIEMWVYIQQALRSIELGTVTVDSTGIMTGVGTEFRKVLRGNTTLVPNKVNIYERTVLKEGASGYTYTLKGTYEVSTVANDTIVYLNTSDVYNTGTYVYSVVGAFSPGQYDGTREEEIYSHDFVDLLFSSSLPSLTKDQYLLCKLTLDTATSTLTIEDLRSENVLSLVLELDGYKDLGASFDIVAGSDVNIVIPEEGNYFRVNLQGDKVIKDITLASGVEVFEGRKIILDIYDTVDELSLLDISSGNFRYYRDSSITGLTIKNSPFILVKTATYWDVVNLPVSKATTTIKGVVELATSSEAKLLTDSEKAITPSALSDVVGGLLTKIVEIGDWDMDTNASVQVAHGLSDFTKIRSVKVMIRDDSTTSPIFYSLFDLANSSGVSQAWLASINSTNVNIYRLTGGSFDGVDFDSTSYNRGWMIIQYIN